MVLQMELSELKNSQVFYTDHIYLHKRPLYLIVQIGILRFLKEHYILSLLTAYGLTVNFPGVQTPIVQNTYLSIALHLL